MSDYKSGLPVRTEADGTDERLHAKLVDGVTPSQIATVDADLNLKVGAYGDNPAGSDIALRLSELGASNPDGDYDATNNTKPAHAGLIVHDRVTSPADTNQNFRITGKQGTVLDTVHALDVAIHDEDGNAFSATNPLPVTMEESEGADLVDYTTTAAVAKDASADHDISVADTKVRRIRKVHISASGKIKAELILGDGAITEVFATKMTGFNSTANTQIVFDLTPVSLTATGTTNTTTIRVQITNLDNQAQDVYSTVLSTEV